MFFTSRKIHAKTDPPNHPAAGFRFGIKTLLIVPENHVAGAFRVGGQHAADVHFAAPDCLFLGEDTPCDSEMCQDPNSEACMQRSDTAASFADQSSIWLLV